MTLIEMKEKIDMLEPWLRRTCWPPMSYMLIPSVLDSAKETLAILETERHTSDEWEAHYQRLHKLLVNFRRIKGDAEYFIFKAEG